MQTHRRFVPLTVLAVLALLFTAPPADAQSSDVAPARAGGVDRYATAATAMTEVAYPQGTGTAIVATGTDFPDALTAAGLAGQAGAALLLTQPDEVEQATATALNDLGATNIYVLGGESAVSQEVVDTIDTSERTVARIGGSDRYETAALVAREVARLGVIDEVAGEPAAFLATGEDFADAVTAGAPAAAGAAAPILLTESNTLPDATAEAIQDLGIGYMWVIGGEAAVNADVLVELENMGIQVQRIAGSDRQATAAEVARTFVNSTVLEGSVVTLARGDEFPDALTGGVMAAATDGPVLLTDSPDNLGTATQGYLSDPPFEISVLRAMGGDAALAPSVLSRAVDIAEGTGTTPAPQSWILTPQEALTRAPNEVADFTLIPDQGDSLPSALHLALYDCQVVDATGSDRSFSDTDNDGLADGYATTETGAAAIAVLNGEDIEDTKAVSAAQTENNELSFRLFSGSPDCAVPVVFEDSTGNGQLDVNANGQPTEPYNVGQVRWQ